MIDINIVLKANGIDPDKCELDEFDHDEQIGRMFFAGWVAANPEVTITDFNHDKYGSWDVAYVSASTKCIGEIKYRRGYDSTTYNDWMLEAKKYDSLKKISNKRPDIKIHYINIFKDYQMNIWDLTDLELDDPSVEILPSTTSVETRDKVKETYYLDNKDTIVRTNA